LGFGALRNILVGAGQFGTLDLDLVDLLAHIQCLEIFFVAFIHNSMGNFDNNLRIENDVHRYLKQQNQ